MASNASDNDAQEAKPSSSFPTPDDIQARLMSKLNMKNKRIILGLPGNGFSASFVASLVGTLFKVWSEKRYDIVLSMGYSSFVAFSRMKTLGLDVMRGPDQKPFDGQDYDVFITIDSDIVFTAKQFIDLVEATDKYPVVSGLYKMANITNYACVKDWDEEHFRKNGSFHFITPDDVTKWKADTKEKYMPVAYNGMGFFAITKAALESIKYPYFWAPLQEIKSADGESVVVRDMCSEDVAFCRNLEEAGYKIWVDTDMVVGHEKHFVI